MLKIDIESPPTRARQDVTFVRRGESDRARLAIDGVWRDLRWGESDGVVNLTLDGKSYVAHVARHGDISYVQACGRTWTVRVQNAVEGAGAAEDSGDACMAPMPGLIVAIKVGSGDSVGAGQTVAIIESMKMQVAIEAQRDGVVAEVCHAEGDSVDRDAILVRLAARES